MQTKTTKIGDFYLDYSEIMRGEGIKEGLYDERILAFMAIKLLIDNNKLGFNFNYKATIPFSMEDKLWDIVKVINPDNSIDYQKSFVNIIEHIALFDKTSFFKNTDTVKFDYENYNLSKYSVSSELQMITNDKVFNFKKYILELPGYKFLAVLDIYSNKADFTGYPRTKYKNLYEDTVTRMKKLSGSLSGQHFTQNSIIDLMTQIGLSDLELKDQIVIYDPSCGVGSMLYESAIYASENILILDEKNKDIDFLDRFLLLGQEINGPTWFLAKVFSEISGFDNMIAFGNTLTEPLLPSFIKEKDIDFIIANPPFGMDWKTEKAKVESIIQIGMDNKEEELFYTITKKIKGGETFVTPKISDGQWLFFMHIAKALESNHKCKALIISSTSLLSNGAETSDEGIIRKHFIENGFIETVIEQPNALFTNTDIKTHLWVMDKKEENKNNVFLIKIDNDSINDRFSNNKGKVLKELRVLFSKANHQIEKQRNGYSEQNIYDIWNLYSRKEDFFLFCKNVSEFKPDYTISFEDFFNVRSRLNNLEYSILTSVDSVRKTEEALMKSYFNSNKSEYITKVIDYTNNSLFIQPEYFMRYKKVYIDLLEDFRSGRPFIDVEKNFINSYKNVDKEVYLSVLSVFKELWKGYN